MNEYSAHSFRDAKRVQFLVGIDEVAGVREAVAACPTCARGLVVYTSPCSHVVLARAQRTTDSKGETAAEGATEPRQELSTLLVVGQESGSIRPSKHCAWVRVVRLLKTSRNVVADGNMPDRFITGTAAELRPDHYHCPGWHSPARLYLHLPALGTIRRML